MADEGEDEEEGLRLWRYVTRSVRPLWRGWENSPQPSAKTAAKPAPRAHPETSGQSRSLPPGIPAALQHPGTGLDRRSDEKLRRGKMAIEGRLDLHGHGRDRAHELLQQFIQDSYVRERRCVLVITGKGRGDTPGVLREAVPGWLSTAPLAALVLRFYSAQPRDGGTGALYVLLRRQRGD